MKRTEDEPSVIKLRKWPIDLDTPEGWTIAKTDKKRGIHYIVEQDDNETTKRKNNTTNTRKD